ncbi:hypothetical protein [Methylocaldum sp. 14B]|jgi:hypothetical protein|uniref:hypothetical protein n=1 Tax=Methylocaldum sp. 14B TaxID=1912213 RepID=UPI00143B54B9|nr:hypothetical protein [Methylocaldum sp. 14B]
MFNEATEPDQKTNLQSSQQAALSFERCVWPALNSGFVGCGEERTASFTAEGAERPRQSELSALFGISFDEPNSTVRDEDALLQELAIRHCSRRDGTQFHTGTDE